MPNTPVGWSRVDRVVKDVDPSRIAAVLKPDANVSSIDLLPYVQWCRENLGEQDREWGLVNQFGNEIWFRFHGAVTLFLITWHHQPRPPLDGKAVVRFLPTEPSSVEWHRIKPADDSHEADDR